MKSSIITLLLLYTFGTLISQDVEGSKDPPLFERLPGFAILDYKVTNFGAYRFCDESGNNIILEGMITYYYYECEGEINPQKIVDKFTAAVLSRGGRVYGTDPQQKYMFYRDTNRAVWVDLYAEDFYYTLNIIEKGERVSDITSEDFLSSLNEKGEAIIYLNFDRDRCEIKDECKGVMEMIAGALAENSDLKLLVAGYTDNIGRSDDNRVLSENRAKTFVEKLIELGISQDRLSWEGYGEDKPIADNSTVEGRTLNNRLVLIKR